MNTLTEEPRSISLYYREGSSDKEYHVRLEPKGAGHVVNIAYGRRGSTLSTGTKTHSPVYYDAALMVFEKLVQEKKSKGYSEGTNGTPYQHNEQESRVTGILPQLLNPVDEQEAARLVANPDWCLQEKKDGRRLLLRKENGSIEGINRKGLVIGLPETLVRSAKAILGEFVLDGECVGNGLHAFDLLSVHGEDLRRRPYRERYVSLLNLVACGLPKHIRVLPVHSDPMDKGFWLARFKRENAEGVVFKRWDAPYIPGRPSSGGSQLKHKFVATLSAVVVKVNTQRSVSLRLLNHEGWQGVGNVPIPVNQCIPQVGTVVEVRYLYAYPDGCLYQPVFLGERTDISPEECGMGQLKFKQSEEG